MILTNVQRIAAIYARVSTTEQADKGYSLPTQIEACRAVATREGYTVPESHVFVDDYTGTSLHRPQFTRLRDLVQQRLVQAVIVYDLDRLSRKLAHQLLLSDELEEAGVTLHIVTMPQEVKTPEGQLLANVRGVFAEYERLKTRERTARGRVGRVKAGFVPGGRRTLGYRYVKHVDKGAHYDVDPEEATVVQRIFQLYVQGGRSQEAIAAQLTLEGVLTPADLRPGLRRTLTARVWHQSTVARILTNETYLGTMYYGKHGNLPGKTNPDRKTRHRNIPREAWIPIAVPPILDAETFQAAQARLHANAQQSRRNRQQEYLFVSGRLRCGLCGCAMSGEINGHGAQRYRCGRGKRTYQDAAGVHTQRSVQARAIEPLVWQAVERVLRNPTLIATEVERRKQEMQTGQGDLDRERYSYTGQLAQCAKDLKRWEAAYLGEAIDLADFKAKKAEIETRRASVERELARLDEQQRLLEQVELETAALRDYCQRVQANLTRFDTSEKRFALEALNMTVVWHPDKPLQMRGSIPVGIATSVAG